MKKNKFIIRKKEITEAAAKMFIIRGYDNITIQDILVELNIAKGTFYHYFKSKNDLLNEIIETEAHKIQIRIDRIVECDSINALEKINKIYQDIGNYKKDKKDIMILLTKYLYQEENYTLRHKMIDRIIEITANKITMIIRQGVKEGIFKTDYPETISEIILNMGLFIRDKFADLLLHPEKKNKETLYNLSLYCKTLEDSMEKILGSAKNTIHIVEYELFEWFLNS